MKEHRVGVGMLVGCLLLVPEFDFLNHRHATFECEITVRESLIENVYYRYSYSK